MKTNELLIILIIISQIIIIFKLIWSRKREKFEIPKISCEEIKNKFESMCMPYAYPPRVGEECDNMYPAYLRCTKQ